MKTHVLLIRTFVAVAATLALVGYLTAQNAAPSVGTRVGVVDISFLFKNHPGFERAMQGMKAEVGAFEGQLRQRGEEIQKIQEQMKGYKPASAEYKQLEAQSLKLQADGQAAAAMKKKDFLEKESQIYFETYNEIVSEIAQFSEQHGFGLVVRFNSEPINAEERESIIEGVNRAVVYQKNLNITFAVQERIKRKSVAAAPSAPRQ